MIRFVVQVKRIHGWANTNADTDLGMTPDEVQQRFERWQKENDGQVRMVRWIGEVI